MITKRTVTVDFSKRAGTVKAVSGLLGGARGGAYLEKDYREELRCMLLPIARIRSTDMPYGANQYVNIHCIFPDFSADPEDEGAYNFLPTDKYLLSVAETGAEIFLCLGEAEERYQRRLYAKMPSDLEKWASVAEHVIAHYNEKWSDGYKLGIKWCEIFPGLDEECEFDGTADEYALLYRTVAKRLKERFPRLKLGAYSAGGFYSLNHFDADDKQKGYIATLEQFLSKIGKDTPLDFFSWKCKNVSPEEISLHANYAASYLSQYGFKKAKSVISELSLECGFAAREYPAYLASSLIIAQKSDTDMMFSSLEIDKGVQLAASEVMRAYGELYKMKSALDVTPDIRREVYSLAAYSKDGAGVLVSTRDFSGMLEILMKNSPFSTYSIKGILGGGKDGEGIVTEHKDIPLFDGKILLKAGRDEVYFISLK